MYEAGLTKPVQHRATFTFQFPDCDKLPPPVLPFVDVSFAYSGKEEDMLYRVSCCPACTRACMLRCRSTQRLNDAKQGCPGFFQIMSHPHQKGAPRMRSAVQSLLYSIKICWLLSIGNAYA